MTSNKRTLTYSLIENRIIDWATGATSIRAIVVYGSRALPNSQSDRYSDLDLILFSTRPKIFAESSGWLNDIGEIWLAVLETTGAGDLEWFTLFQNGLKVDVILAHATPSANISSLVDSSPYSEALYKGNRVLYQASGKFQPRELLAVGNTQPFRMRESLRTQDIDLALMRIVKATMLFCRGDSERCRSALNGSVYRQLKRIVHSNKSLTKYIASRDQHLNTEGSELALSTFEQLILSREFDDIESMKRALTYVIDLVTLLAEDLSTARGLHLPDSGQEKTIAWLQKLLILSGSRQRKE